MSESMVRHLDLDDLNDVDMSEGLANDGYGNQHFCEGCDYYHAPLDTVEKVLDLDMGVVQDSYWFPDDRGFDYDANVFTAWRCDGSEWISRYEPSGRKIDGAWQCAADDCYYPYGREIDVDYDEARDRARNCCGYEPDEDEAPQPVTDAIEAALNRTSHLVKVDLDAIATKH
jgi:hypothetical protein